MITACLAGFSCGLFYLVIALWLKSLGLRSLARRCAEHLGNECHTGIHDIDTHRALWDECEREGWDEKGRER